MVTTGSAVDTVQRREAEGEYSADWESTQEGEEVKE